MNHTSIMFHSQFTLLPSIQLTKEKKTISLTHFHPPEHTEWLGRGDTKIMKKQLCPPSIVIHLALCEVSTWIHLLS